MPLYSPWQSKPWPGTDINWSHPYAQGLVAAWVFNEGAGMPIELVSGSGPTASTAFGWTNARDGNVGSFNGTTTNLTYSGLPAVGPAMSLAGSCAFANVFGGNGMLIERENVNATWCVFDEAGNFKFRGGDASSIYLFNLAGIPNNQLFSWCFTINASGTTAGYLNGILQSNSGAGGVSPVSNTNPIHLGNYDNSGYFMGGQQSYIYIWNYAISADQAIGITINPWQIFVAQPAYWLMGAVPVVTVSPASFGVYTM